MIKFLKLFIGLEHFNFEHWLLFRISDLVLRIYLLYIVFKVIPTAKTNPMAQYWYGVV